MSWFTSIKEMLPMSVQKQMRRTNEFSPANSPALVRYHDPKKGPKYPEELNHLPYRTRPSTESEYRLMESAHKSIGYEEIDSIRADDDCSRCLPTDRAYIIHPLSRRKVRRLHPLVLDMLKEWITSNDIYKGTDVQSQMFTEARKETLDRVEKEIFKWECKSRYNKRDVDEVLVTVADSNDADWVMVGSEQQDEEQDEEDWVVVGLLDRDDEDWVLV